MGVSRKKRRDIAHFQGSVSVDYAALPIVTIATVAAKVDVTSNDDCYRYRRQIRILPDFIMHEAHWGLTTSPFRGVTDPRFFYESPTHDEALARLLFLVENRRRLAILVGRPGSGKSFTLEIFKRKLKREGHDVAVVNAAYLNGNAFLQSVSDSLRLLPVEGAQDFQLWRMIVDRVSMNRYRQAQLVLLIDNADLADPVVLQHVGRLLAADSGPDAQVSVAITATPQGVPELSKAAVQLADLRIELESWEIQDTLEYLESVLAAAGRTQPLFLTAAVARMHEISHGIPRRICQLAELALLAGAGQELENIDRHTIETVFRELSAGGLQDNCLDFSQQATLSRQTSPILVPGL